jgi:hypothetical protein
MAENTAGILVFTTSYGESSPHYALQPIAALQSAIPRHFKLGSSMPQQRSMAGSFRAHHAWRSSCDLQNAKV